jgi:hypothetical protein
MRVFQIFKQLMIYLNHGRWFLRINYLERIFFSVSDEKKYGNNSSSLKADAWHHRVSITFCRSIHWISVALLGKGYESADDWAALLLGFILFNAYLIFNTWWNNGWTCIWWLIENIRSVASSGRIIDTEKCFIRESRYEISRRPACNR